MDSVSRPRWIMLVFAALLLTFSAGCVVIEEAPRTDPPGTPVASPDDEDLYDLEREVERQINDIREEHGLHRLEPDETLAAVARAYSCRMAEEDFFAHESPDGDTVDDRVLAAGVEFRVVGENLAQSTGAPNPGDLAVEGWMESEGHRENILREEYTQSGLGTCRFNDSYYFTQIFLAPR